MHFTPSELIVKASENLQEEVQRELASVSGSPTYAIEDLYRRQAREHQNNEREDG